MLIIFKSLIAWFLWILIWSIWKTDRDQRKRWNREEVGNQKQPLTGKPFGTKQTTILLSKSVILTQKIWRSCQAIFPAAPLRCLAQYSNKLPSKQRLTASFVRYPCSSFARIYNAPHSNLLATLQWFQPFFSPPFSTFLVHSKKV